MTTPRHEIPTHLNVEDKAFFGLSVRQVLFLVSGLSTSYALWSQWPELPAALRLGLAAANLLLAAAFALLRPGRRGLEEWAFVALHYAATPKVATWRPREPDPADWRPARSAWAELTPRVTWSGDPDAAGDPACPTEGDRR
jgi:hypothetical protein